MNGKPLDHLRVLDLSEGIAGGYAAKLLGDAGAEVIKAEGPDGDPLRRRAHSSESSAYPLFSHLHADHTLERIESSEASGQARVRELVSWADVVLEGSDTSAKAALHSVCENLPTDPNRGRVHVCISPFGATGPWQSRDANEFTLQGWSGKLVTNYAGPADRPPAAAGGEAG